MKRFDILTFIISISTFSAVLVSYFTLKELQSGRELAILPDVFISNDVSQKILFGDDFANCAFLQPFKLYNNKRDEIVNDLNLPIRNLGFGSAKYLDIDWKLDYNNISGQLVEQYQEDNTLRIEDNDYGSFQETVIMCKQDTIFWGQISNQSIDFLSPTLNKNTFNTIKVPDELLMISLYDHLMTEKTGNESINPSIDLHIGFQNIQNDVFFRSYKVELDLYYRDTLNDLNTLDIGVKIEEIMDSE